MLHPTPRHRRSAKETGAAYRKSWLESLDKDELKVLIKQEDGDNSLEINEYIEAGRIWRREGFDAALAHLRVLKER